MISTEYTLVKWNDEEYEELEITIQEESVKDFCEMMEWEEEEFTHNTIRRPIACENQELDPESEEYVVEEDSKKLPKKMHELIAEKDPYKKRHRRTNAEIEEARQKPLGEYSNKKIHFESEEGYFCNFKSNKTLKRNLMTKDWEKVTCGRCKFKRGKSKVNIDRPKRSKQMGRRKKYTDEVVEFLRENINNFSNKELCEELESQFNIKVKPDAIGPTMSLKGIKRDGVLPEGIPEEIVKFIMKSKQTDAYIMKDDIIEKFEKDFPVRKVMLIMKKRDLAGENVNDEVKRIKDQREDEELDFLDEE